MSANRNFWSSEEDQILISFCYPQGVLSTSVQKSLVQASTQVSRTVKACKQRLHEIRKRKDYLQNLIDSTAANPMPVEIETPERLPLSVIRFPIEEVRIENGYVAFYYKPEA